MRQHDRAARFCYALPVPNRTQGLKPARRKRAIYVYIYALAEPDTGDVRYIGKTKNPVGRYAGHLKAKGEVRRDRWVRSLTRVSKKPLLFILESVSDSEWQDAERRWIATYRAEGTDLTNHTDGGEGLCNPNQETRDKIAAIRRKLMQDPEHRARIFTPERGAAISRALAGKPKPWVARLPQNQPGYVHRPEFGAKISVAMLGNQYALGMRHSEATKALIARLSRGNQHAKGRVMPEEEKLRRAIACRKNTSKTEEHAEKIAAGMRAYWATKPKRAPKARIDWPPLEEVEQMLATATGKQVAAKLGVKPGTLGAWLVRRRRGIPERGKVVV